MMDSAEIDWIRSPGPGDLCSVYHGTYKSLAAAKAEVPAGDWHRVEPGFYETTDGRWKVCHEGREWTLYDSVRLL